MEEKTIKNKASLEFELCDEKVTVESNQVETKPVKLKIEKKQNCDFVIVGHNIKYTIEIENECQTDLEDLLFKDVLDSCTEFVEHSFKVNGATKTPEIKGNTLEFVVEKLKGCDDLTITFEVKVTDRCCDCKNDHDD